MKITLPDVPFDLPPKPRELTAAVSRRARKIDGSIKPPETDEPVVEATEAEAVPLGKRQDWVVK